MAKVAIISESLPQRCEVCHQADCFDAANNSCSRCQNLAVEKIIKPAQPYINLKNILIYFGAIISGLSFAVFFGLASFILFADICFCRCRSIFHPLHLYIPFPMLLVGFSLGITVVLRVDSAVIKRVIKRAFKQFLIGIPVGTIAGALSAYFYEMRDLPFYLPPLERAYLGALYGLQIAILVGVIIQSLLVLVRLIDSKLRSESKSK